MRTEDIYRAMDDLMDQIAPSKDDPSFTAPIIRKARRWALRALVNLGGMETILSPEHCTDPNLLQSLEVQMPAEYDRATIIKALKDKLQELNQEEINDLGDHVLVRNLDLLAKELALTQNEQTLLLFCILERQSPFLRSAVASLGGLSTSRAIVILSNILDIPSTQVRIALSSEGTLAQTGLLTIDDCDIFDFGQKIDLISGLADQMLLPQNSLLDLFKKNFVQLKPSVLSIDDFAYMGKKVQHLQAFLKCATEDKMKGVNILIWGLPGYGKSELARVLCQSIGADGFEVSTDPPESRTRQPLRFLAYKLSQSILAARTNSAIIFDEMEDISAAFPGDFSSGSLTNRSGIKASFNQLLEENPVPAIFITNNINFIDPAHLRRFQMIIEMTLPPRQTRKRILERATAGLELPKEWTHDLASHPELSPAMINRVSLVAKRLHQAGVIESAQSIMENLIDSQLRTSGRRFKMNALRSGLVAFDLNYVNVDCDVSTIVDGLKNYESGRLCLSGVSGSGKSAFARHIAEELNRPLITKKASDLLGAYVGETESAIAEMFEEASAENAVLLIDEADSFLRSRERGSRRWETTMTNQLLTSIEEFDGILCVTTNMFDELDSAVLRRFDLKIKFDYLNADQRIKLFEEAAIKLNLTSSDKLLNQVKALSKLTPGDFASVIRGARLRPISSGSELADRLTKEVHLKQGSSGRSIGFAQ